MACYFYVERWRGEAGETKTYQPLGVFKKITLIERKNKRGERFIGEKQWERAGRGEKEKKARGKRTMCLCIVIAEIIFM